MMLLLTGMLSCGESSNRTLHTELDGAAAVMGVHPDSALRLLETLSLRSCHTAEDSARYALLLTQARDKNFVPQKHDSLIHIAVRYYNAYGTEEQKALVYFYLASVYRDARNRTESMKNYLRSLSYIRQGHDLRLQGMIYNNIAFLYYEQNMYDKADSVYRKVGEISLEIGDTVMYCENLLQRGKVMIEHDKKFYEHADSLFRLVYPIAEKLSGHFWLLQDCIAYLTELYIKKNNVKKALLYSRKNLKIQTDSVFIARAYSFLGRSYYLNAQFDSAIVYLHKAVMVSNATYATKINSYGILEKIAKIQGNWKIVSQMKELSAHYRDSLQVSIQPKALDEAVNNVQMERHYQQLYHGRYYEIELIVGIVIVFFSSFYFWKRRKVKKRMEALEVQSPPCEQEVSSALPDSLEKESVQDKQKAISYDLRKSPVYEKMYSIIDDCKKKDRSTQSMNADDWQQLMNIVDARSEGFTTRLREQYDMLDNEDIYLCCLLLTDIRIKHIAYLFNITRDAVYKRSNRILAEKMKVDAEKGKIQLYDALSALL